MCGGGGGGKGCGRRDRVHIGTRRLNRGNSSSSRISCAESALCTDSARLAKLFTHQILPDAAKIAPNEIAKIAKIAKRAIIIAKNW